MATKTEHFSLEKPSEQDFYDIYVFNRNFDQIDRLLGEGAERGARLADDLGGKGAAARLGGAAEAAALEPNGLLFLTDDGAAAGVAVTLADLLAEGKAAAEGGANRLAELATVGTANALNLRADGSGARFAANEDFATKIREMCAIALENGNYLTDDALCLSWKQVQSFLLDGALPTATAAEGRAWAWCADGADRLAALEEEVRALRALIGDLNGVLDTINDTEGAS